MLQAIQNSTVSHKLSLQRHSADYATSETFRSMSIRRAIMATDRQFPTSAEKLNKARPLSPPDSHSSSPWSKFSKHDSIFKRPKPRLSKIVILKVGDRLRNFPHGTSSSARSVSSQNSLSWTGSYRVKDNIHHNEVSCLNSEPPSKRVKVQNDGSQVGKITNAEMRSVNEMIERTLTRSLNCCGRYKNGSTGPRQCPVFI